MDAPGDWILACAGALILQALVMLVHAWEHRRYHAARWQASPAVAPLRVMLIVPCKGIDRNLSANLKALFEQRYTRLKICFVVECLEDPAIDVIRQLQQQFPNVASRIVIAGAAIDCGQKVHNLMAASRQVPNNTDVLAFCDSDACPHPDWLTRLVSRLVRRKNAVATGYRWYDPVAPTWPNRLLAAINNTIIELMGPHGFNLVWGGAWAIRSETFKALGLPEAWRGSLSDDLVVSRLVRRARLKVAYEPYCLVRSVADFHWSTLGEFLRRQFIVARVYAPAWWRTALFSATLINLGFWALVGLAAIRACSGGAWDEPALAALLLYGLTALRHFIGAKALKPYLGTAQKGNFEAALRLNILGWPLVTLANWIGLLASSLGRTIVWRGIGYRLDSPARTTILSRPLSTNRQVLPDNPANQAQRAA
jgi:ceramide glucosyltransferase